MADKDVSLIDQLREKRSGLVDKWGEFIQKREVERAAFEARTDATDDDVAAFAAAEEKFKAGSEKREADIKELDERIRVQGDVSKRRAKAAKASVDAPAVVTSEPLTYRQDNGFGPEGSSYYRDLTCVMNTSAGQSFRSTNMGDARDRLFRHAMEMDVEMPKRAAAREERARRAAEKAEAEFRGSFHAGMGVRQSRGDFNPFERRVAPNRTDGQGGYFVPPLWLDQYIAGLRPGRVAAGLARQMDLPAGTDSINVPKLSTLTTTAIQGADNQPVSSTDFTDTAVTATVKTIAGQEDVAIQLLDQSPYHLDMVLTTDLLADYDKQLDLQVLSGNGSNSTTLNGGQVQGLYSSAGASPWTSYNSVSYTNSSPAPWNMFPVMGAMASNIARNRFTLNSLAYVLHPRRAFWFATGTDSNYRPIVEPSNFGPFNVTAIEAGSVPAEGLVMRLPWGAPVYHDANVPTADTAGSGSGQDIAIGAVWDDAWLFEGEMRTRVLPEVLSGTLQVRIQVYNYVAFLLRYGQSLAIGSGTGFSAPSAVLTLSTWTTPGNTTF